MVSHGSASQSLTICSWSIGASQLSWSTSLHLYQTVSMIWISLSSILKRKTKWFFVWLQVFLFISYRSTSNWTYLLDDIHRKRFTVIMTFLKMINSTRHISPLHCCYNDGLYSRSNWFVLSHETFISQMVIYFLDLEIFCFYRRKTPIVSTK